MSSKGKRPMRALTAGDKIEAIQRVNDGESKASVARDIGVPESTLRGWCKNEDKLRYMSSRRSTPDTDKSSDGEPREKRARTITPPAEPDTPSTGLDLSAATTNVQAAAPPQPPPSDVPVELTTKRHTEQSSIRRDPTPTAPILREQRRPEPVGASVSMSAISPLSGLAHLPGLGTHSPLGLSFNEIATNLSLLAQLNPGLSALTAAPASRALRSVRSPKPQHNGVLNLSDKHRSHHTDHHNNTRTKAKDPVDETLWYWLKTQQAMLDLTAAQTAAAAAHPMRSNKPLEPTLPPKPVAPTPQPTIPSHLDYNRNSWLWQYYKQFGGAMPVPEDKLKSASQVPKEKNENILYSHLTKGKTGEDKPIAMTRSEEVRVSSPAGSPPVAAVEGKENFAEREPRCQIKARTVLDSLLFSGGGSEETMESKVEGEDGRWESGAQEALEHGDKFLTWLESSGDPSVTRMHVHQLRALLQNLRGRRRLPVPTPAQPQQPRSAPTSVTALAQ